MSGAERMRDLRRRRAAGRIVVSIEVARSRSLRSLSRLATCGSMRTTAAPRGRRWKRRSTTSPSSRCVTHNAAPYLPIQRACADASELALVRLRHTSD
jgi:hypothetical protein